MNKRPRNLTGGQGRGLHSRTWCHLLKEHKGETDRGKHLGRNPSTWAVRCPNLQWGTWPAKNQLHFPTSLQPSTTTWLSLANRYKQKSYSNLSKTALNGEEGVCPSLLRPSILAGGLWSDAKSRGSPPGPRGGSKHRGGANSLPMGSHVRRPWTASRVAEGLRASPLKCQKLTWFCLLVSTKPTFLSFS